MVRHAFLLDVPDMGSFMRAFSENEKDVRAFAAGEGLTNASGWYVDRYAFFYAERGREGELRIPAVLEDAFAPFCSYIARPGEMRLMYRDDGVIRQDKSLIRHRVFATLIHEGCADEYKARHDALSARREAMPPVDHADSNFTIWCARGRYNFGYCEKVLAFDHEMTEAEKADTVAWETRMLEIMDWITDDVDWITKERHPAMKNLFME